MTTSETQQTVSFLSPSIRGLRETKTSGASKALSGDKIKQKLKAQEK